jgi:hypothetical protein
VRERAVYVTSVERLSGKSVVAIALACLAKDEGLRAGYFKPVSLSCVPGPGGELVDEDVETMEEILGLEVGTCPLRLSGAEFLRDYKDAEPSSLRERILGAYRRASGGKELMLIEGPHTLSAGSFLGCHVPRLASLLGAKLLIVMRYKDDFVVDEALQARDYCAHWDASISGIILNRVEAGEMEKAREIVKPLLEREGLKVLGLLPEDKVLGSLTVREVHEAIGGELIAGSGGLDNPVETVLVGAMTPESAIQYFRRVKNELIVTGGDRTDIVLAALEAGASALILTGNLYPSVKVLPRADELRIPMIVVPQDTYTTLQQIQRIVGRIKPRDTVRIAAAKRLVQENVNWKEALCE